MDRSTKKAKITTGLVDVMQVTGEGLCGGVVASLIKMYLAVSSQNTTRMMCLTTKHLKIHKNEKKESS